VAINDDIAAHGDQKEIDKAKDELAKGDSDFAAGKYKSGIERLGDGNEGGGQTGRLARV
jgi:hypothetical protein